MFELTLTGVKKYMDATLVLEDITFQAYAGEKVGIVGVNGSGKSTILKLIAGILPMNYWPGYPQTSSYGYDEGFVRMSRKATASYLEQIPQYDENSKVIDILNLAFEDVYAIESQMRALEEKMNGLEDEALDKALKQYGELADLYEVKGGYEVHEKLAKICTGLMFDESFFSNVFL